MIERKQDLQLFVDAAFVAFDQFVRGAESRRSILNIFGALETAMPEHNGNGSRLPVCELLEDAIPKGPSKPGLTPLIERFRALEPRLQWRRKTVYDPTASENFDEGHANAMIIGPGGLEERSDLWLGVTLMAPNVRYPDHDHAPEEVYLVLSPGEFRQGAGDWFSPGIGGSFYNLPGIRHAMRSSDVPLLAFWALSADFSVADDRQDFDP